MIHSCPATHDCVADALDDLVHEILQKLQLDRPPVDALAIARELGIEVRIDQSQRARGRLVRRCQAIICLRPEPRHERIQWVVAHEIGEHIMPDIAERLNLQSAGLDPQSREALANRFAGRLLAPAAWWEFDAPLAGYDLFELKTLYATVSYEVLALRMLDLDPPTIVSVFDNRRLTRRDCNLSLVVNSVHPAERECQRCSHELGTPWQCVATGLHVQAWPIHEPGWKREIVRAVVDLDALADHQAAS